MYSQKDVTINYIHIASQKAAMPYSKMLISGILAGMFIAFAAAGANTVSSTVGSASIARLLSGCVFPCGLIMVVISGSELFTGNCLMVISLLERKLRMRHMLMNWLWVYAGNFIGAMLVVAFTYFGGQWGLFNGGLLETTIAVANTKAAMSFSEALFLGICCNFLVCIAVWFSLAAKKVSGKILAIFMPIMLFVLCGFEHSVANMYYVPAGIFAAGETLVPGLSWSAFFLNNLIPVTLGNIIGGSLCVGLPVWFLNLWNKEKNGQKNH